MRPGRETDVRIAKEVFGHKVWAQGKVLYENAAKGDRPLRSYTKEMEWAAEVVEKMHMTLIPIQGGEWFAFVGPELQLGWESPQAVLEFLNSGNFNDCGAAVGTSLPLVICDAALKAVEKRAAIAEQPVADQTSAEATSSTEASSNVH
ncbi:MAG: hypothetical protein V4692_03870 [Bdellovibrionota bacterium]